MRRGRGGRNNGERGRRRRRRKRPKTRGRGEPAGTGGRSSGASARLSPHGPFTPFSLSILRLLLRPPTLNRPGAMLSTAPTSSPPALLPLMANSSGVVLPSAAGGAAFASAFASAFAAAEAVAVEEAVEARNLATATKSEKVFFLVKYLPSSSYQLRPISPPPRTCAIT